MDALINTNHLKLFSDTTDLFKTVADDFMRRALAAVNAQGFFNVVLAGGSTPKLFFDTLTANELYVKKIPWPEIKFFFGDERYVAADSAESNYHMALTYLFAKVAVPAANIYRIPTEFSDPKKSAENYQHTLRKVFNNQDNELPVFDLVYLGLGDDAHTASLMPFSDVVKQNSANLIANAQQLVAALWVPRLNMYRITLTPLAINNSRCICFLVTGANKAPAVWNVLEGPHQPQHYPAQLIQAKYGETLWYLDEAAAIKLGFPLS